MPRIAVVGCGFLGSIFTHEAVRRLHTAEIKWDWRFIDFDDIEERNCSNQNYSPAEAGEMKASALAGWVEGWNEEHVEYNVDRLTAARIDNPLDGAALIVDAVDNLETRQLIWSFGVEHKIPILHLGMTAEGQGKVEWTAPEIDTFSLSPIALQGRMPKDPEIKLPPCELARFRGAGLLTGYAGAVALGLFFGFNPEGWNNGSTEPSLVTFACSGKEVQELPEFTVTAEL